MKAIIFDLDNTLIPWLDDYIDKIINGMVKFNVKKENTYKIYELVDVYESSHSKLDKKELLEFMNAKLDNKLKIDLIDDYIDLISSCTYKEEGVEETLDYLSKKYDLYVITNWFTASQTKRLETVGYAKYFKQIIGADQNYYKPDKRTFDIILEKYKSEECVSVGDSIKNDIDLPLSLGMQAIWKTNETSTKYKTIKNISDLRNIL